MVIPEEISFFLREGEMFVSGKPVLVRTVLGSCVAVTMFDRRLGTGAIFHSLLPRCADTEPCGGCSAGYRFVECSIKKTAAVMKQRGARKEDLEVKVFGGADMNSPLHDGLRITDVGRRNIETALDVISAAGFKVAASDLGGSRGRKIIFRPHTGEVFLKRLKDFNGE